MGLKNTVLFLIVFLVCLALFGTGKTDFEDKLNRYYDFSFDSLLFGKVPSIFYHEKGYSEEESFKHLAENLKKNRDRIFFLIEDLNLVLKIESLNFKLSDPVIIARLKEFYRDKSDFIFEYVDVFQALLGGNEKKLDENLEELKIHVDDKIGRKVIIGLLYHFFKDDPAYLENVFLKLTDKIGEDVFTNYVCGKIALYILENEGLGIIFWKAALVESKGELKKSLPSILIKNIKKYRRYRKRKVKNVVLEKFYLEMRIWDEPGNPVWLNNLGYFLGETGEFKKAVEYCEKAVKLKPTNPYFLDSLGWVLYRSGKSEKGLEYLKKAIEYKPEFYEALYHISTIHYAREDYKKAEEFLRNAIAADGTKPVAKNDLGYILIETDGNYAEGMDYVREALKAEPRNPFYLDSLGWGYYKIGKYGEAAKYLGKSYMIRPLYDNMIHLGTNLIALGMFDKASSLLIDNYNRWPRSDRLTELVGMIDLLKHLEEKIKTAENEKKRNYYMLLQGNLYAGMDLPFHAFSIIKRVLPVFNRNRALLNLKKLLGIKIIRRYFKGLPEYPVQYIGRIPLYSLFYVYCGIFEKDLFRLLNFDQLISASRNSKDKKQKKDRKKIPESFFDLYRLYSESGRDLVVGWKIPKKRIKRLLMSLVSGSKFMKTLVFGEKLEITAFGLVKFNFFPADADLLVGSVSGDFEKIYARNYVLSGIMENLKSFNRDYLLDLPVSWFRKISSHRFVDELVGARLSQFEKIQKKDEVSVKFEFQFKPDTVGKKEYVVKVTEKEGRIEKIFSDEVSATSYYKEGKNESGTTVNTHTMSLIISPAGITPDMIRKFINKEKTIARFFFKARKYFTDVMKK